MYVMNPTATATIGTNDDAVTFTVSYFVTDAGRTRWQYIATAHDGAPLARGTDLSTPDYAEADAALDSLLSFAGAAGDPHSGAGDCGFPEIAVTAFAAICDELVMATIE